MKKLLIILCIGLGFKGLSQTNLYNEILLETVAENYSVTAAFDTTYTRQLVITIADPLAVQNIEATLALQTEQGWQTEQAVILAKPDTSVSSCVSPLCMYRKNESQWVLVLGNFSLLSRHRIQLHFNSQFTNTTNTDWEQEF